MTQYQYGIVLITAASLAEADMLAELLIQEHLAACVNILPVRSIYRWKGEVQHDEEYQLVVKTRLDRFADLTTRVQAVHSYEVPEMIALPIVEGFPTYLQWLSEQLNP